jgi:hypothetical protein
LALPLPLSRSLSPSRIKITGSGGKAVVGASQLVPRGSAWLLGAVSSLEEVESASPRLASVANSPAPSRGSSKRSTPSEISFQPGSEETGAADSIHGQEHSHSPPPQNGGSGGRGGGGSGEKAASSRPLTAAPPSGLCVVASAPRLLSIEPSDLSILLSDFSITPSSGHAFGLRVGGRLLGREVDPYGGGLAVGGQRHREDVEGLRARGVRTLRGYRHVQQDSRAAGPRVLFHTRGVPVDGPLEHLDTLTRPALGFLRLPPGFSDLDAFSWVEKPPTELVK